jgi:hypothetical protein
MKKLLLFLVCFTFFSVTSSHADFFGSLLEKIDPLTKAVESASPSSDPLSLGSTETIVSGLKEALSVGIEKAVQTVSQMNGFYNNPNIKISLPRHPQTSFTNVRER